MSTFQKILITIALLLIVMISGFLIGKYCFRPEPEIITHTVVKYLPGDTIRITREKPVPYKVTDTITITPDTAKLYAAWREYNKTNEYELDFSNDTVGTFKVNAKVHQNEITEVQSTIIPIIKTTETSTTEKSNNVKFIQGFVAIGTSVHNFNTQQVTVGAEFVNRYDVSATAIRYNSDFTYTINFGIKF